MNEKETKFLEEGIIRFIADNKQGVSMKVILDYLDYINRVVYTESQIKPIIDKLIGENKISQKGKLLFP